MEIEGKTITKPGNYDHVVKEAKFFCILSMSDKSLYWMDTNIPYTVILTLESWLTWKCSVFNLI